jgi:PKD repeat protein
MEADGGGVIIPPVVGAQVNVVKLVEPFPGYTDPPLDPDGDGLYEDVNGNGRLDFDDVVVFYQNIQWIRDNSGVGTDPYDFNGNGRIDYDDIVLLYYEVLAG